MMFMRLACLFALVPPIKLEKDRRMSELKARSTPTLPIPGMEGIPAVCARLSAQRTYREIGPGPNYLRNGGYPTISLSEVFPLTA
jgi:hypothetical protein